MTAKFISRENIRKFKAELLSLPDGDRKATISKLLAKEEHHLRALLSGKD